VTARQIVDELVVVDRHPVFVKRVALVLPMVPEDAPARIREGIERRRLTAITGRCPCGATLDCSGAAPGPIVDPQSHHGSATTSNVEHEAGCPAITETLAKAIRRWVR
jgi:hypothetical protein